MTTKGMPVKWLAAVALCVFAVGCNDTIGGIARPAPDLGTSTPATTAAAPSTPAAPQVPPDGAKKLLLPIPEIEGIVGDTGMNNPIVLTEPGQADVGIAPRECTPIGLPGRQFLFDTNRQAFAGEANRGAGTTSVGQVVTTFGTAENATSALETEKRSWERCPEGEPYTALGDGPDSIRHWVRGAVQATPERVSVDATRQEAPVRTCHHILAAKANAVVESIVCGGGDTTAQSTQIADRILAKISG
jgi:hypothetical protein